MRIGYRKRLLNINLIFGCIWFTYFSIKFAFSDMHWIDYGWLLISLAYFMNYFYQKTYKYLTIENGFISVNGPFGKKLKLDDIKQIRKFAGDYILKSDKKELFIYTKSIDPDLLSELDAELEKLNLEWT